MNTITKTASTTTILAIDLGKYKSIACLHDDGSGEYRFTTFDTSRGELGKLLAKEQPAVVIIEACLLAGWVHDRCGEVGVRCLVANTASEAWKFKHLKRKTDKDDALRLAQLYLLGQLPTVTLPPTAVRQWRSLIATRQALVGRRVAVQNRIRALFVAQGLPVPRGVRAWSATGLAGIATQAKALTEIERRLDDVLRLIRTGRFSTPMLAEEVGVSIPTISRIVAALRDRGHDIRAERHAKESRYVLAGKTAGTQMPKADRFTRATT